MPILKGDKIFPFSLHNLFDYLPFILYLRSVIEREKAHLCKREGLSLEERSQNAQNGKIN